MIHQNQLMQADRQVDRIGQDERGATFMIVMMLMLMTGVLGVAALTMTGLGNSMAGALRMVEEGTHAAESCIGTAVRVINLVIDDADTPSVVAPLGPVPALNAAILRQEISGSFRNNPDVAVGAGNAPNLVMTVNGYTINGDIDILHSRLKVGSNAAEDGSNIMTYRIDCTAVNAATGATSRVIAVFDCLIKSDTCQRKADV